MTGGTAIETKLVNALIPDAEPDEAIELPYVDRSTWKIVRRFKSYYGGLSVGGEAKLTDTHLVFEPNSMNKAVHTDDTSFALPLNAIIEVTVEPGFLTKIIAMHTREGAYRIRCFGAAKFAERIRQRARTAAG